MSGDECLEDDVAEAPRGSKIPDEICPYADELLDQLKMIKVMSKPGREIFFKTLNRKDAYLRRNFVCTGTAPEICSGCQSYTTCYHLTEKDIPEIDLCGIRTWLEAAGIHQD
jgi:hypothetical protein